MILYLTNRYHKYTIETWIDSWGRSMRSRFRVLDYLDIPFRRRFEADAVIFTDFERLSEVELDLAVQLWDGFREQSASSVLFNDPRKVISRTALLDRLWEAGINRFRAYPAAAARNVDRFPVFVRHAREHTGPQTELLPDAESLRHAIDGLVSKGTPVEDLLVVEYVDVLDDLGLYPKYAAFRIGEMILPRAVGFGRSWVQKEPDVATSDAVRRERKYVCENPHEEWIRSVFEISGITFGRIDYGLVKGEPQAFEINTNPVIQLHPSAYRRLQLPLQRELSTRFTEVFSSLAVEGAGRAFAFDFREDERIAARDEARRQRIIRRSDHWRHRVYRRRHLRNAIQAGVWILQRLYRAAKRVEET